MNIEELEAELKRLIKLHDETDDPEARQLFKKTFFGNREATRGDMFTKENDRGLNTQDAVKIPPYH